jgi:hypothetical protein
MSVDKTQVTTDNPTIAILPPDLILKLFEWVPHLNIKRFGRTSLGYHKLVQDYENSPAYTSLLICNALDHFAAVLVMTHARCNKGDITLLKANAEAYSLQVAAVLASCPAKPISDWSMVHRLWFLYPAASMADWLDAPYALEWCARHERTILGIKPPAPRHELLALLHNNASDQLMVLEEKEVARSLAIRNSLGFAPQVQRTQNLCVTFLIAVRAASNICSSEWHPNSYELCGPRIRPSIKIKLSQLRAVANSLCEQVLPLEDQAWLYLAGLGKNNKRAPKKLLSEFDCRRGGSRE